MKNIALLLSLIFAGQIGFAQQYSCGTDKYHEELRQNNPVYQAAYEQHLKELTEIGENPVKERLSKKAVVTIPIVFHIIHEYGEENISKEQILDQMRILNEDFRRLNADTSKTRAIFKDVAVDCEIEFKLATKDPEGNCTDGITRTVSSLTNGGDEDVKDLIRWNYRQYLNVWVIDHIGRSGDDGTIVAGYSRFPTATSESEDGIVINHAFVGSIGTSNSSRAGRTLTHEIGHWLGLFHPFQNSGWSDDCGTTNCLTSGDRVCDTPPVLSASFGCPTDNNTCTNDSPDLPDQIENFMDYANGSCTNMFTKGQKDVMDYYLSRTQYRGQNVSAATISATGINVSNPCAPKADFHVVGRNTVICQGGSLEFEDLSWNGDIVDRVWTFEGGSPSTSTFRNPTVAYNQPGTYKVTLKVINDQGNSEVTKTEFITVQKEVADLASPFRETFESEWSEFTWSREEDGDNGWKRLTGNGYDQSYAAVCAINSETSGGMQYNMYSPNFDLSAHKSLSPVLSFRAAYSMRESGSAGERLVMYGSDDCGQTWKVLRSLIGITTLKSKDGYNPGWAPTSNSDWKVHSVALDQYGFENSTNLILRFEVTSNSGNAVYLDDINVDRNVLSTPDFYTSNIGFSVAPNPSSGDFEVRVNEIYEPINIEVTDLLGQKLQTLNISNINNGQVRTGLTIHGSGVYFVRIYNDHINSTKRIIISE